MLKNLLHQVLRRRDAKRKPPGAASPSGLQAIRLLLDARDLGRAEQALDALGGAPSADALWMRAELVRKRGDGAAAEPLFRAALRLDPRHRESWMSLGVLCYRSGRLAHAHQYFRAVLALDPNDAEALNELGLVELAYGNRTDARSSFESLLDRHPGRAEAWNNLGLALAGQSQLAEACRAFRRALSLQPGHLTACANLGLACRDMNRPQEALEAFETARRLDPGAPGVRVGLALALQDLGDLEGARAELDQALTLEPDNVDALSALGALLLRLGLAEVARRVLAKARSIAPEDPEARLATAHLLLAQGEYGEGWECYEARLKSRASPRRSYPVPHWEGAEPPRGRRILVYGEQGLGEQVMFASMLGELAREAEVTLDCEPRLRALFARSFDRARVMDVAEERAALRERFDACIAIGSLARYYRREARAFPEHGGYLKPDPARADLWQRRLGELGPGAKIGVSWRGGLASTGGALRSLEVDALAALVRQPGTLWISLQHDARAQELERFRAHAPLLHDSAALGDIDDTAALMSALDLMIVPCSSAAHLAGALARPVWVLTPFAPAWRYRIEGERMPWYPSARLFRQPGPAAWPSVLESVSRSLSVFCARRLEA